MNSNNIGSTLLKSNGLALIRLAYFELGPAMLCEKDMQPFLYDKPVVGVVSISSILFFLGFCTLYLID